MENNRETADVMKRYNNANLHWQQKSAALLCFFASGDLSRQAQRKHNMHTSGTVIDPPMKGV